MWNITDTILYMEISIGESLGLLIAFVPVTVVVANVLCTTIVSSLVAPDPLCIY